MDASHGSYRLEYLSCSFAVHSVNINDPHSLQEIITILFRYGIHLWDIEHTTMWEGRSTWSYNTDLILDLAMYTVDFAHHLHMLVSVII